MVNIALVVLIWGIVFAGVQKGFDLTDESFYLLNYHNYQDATIIDSVFGVLLKPLYDLSGQHIIAFRRMGALLLFWAAAGVSAATLAILQKKTPDWLSLAMLPTGAAAIYYYDWLTTPSYNWSNLIGLMLFWAGWLIWMAAERKVGLFLLAFSSVIVFWSKATSAVFLVGFVGLAFVFNLSRLNRLTNRRAVFWGGAGLALGASLPLLLGEIPQQIIQKLTDGTISKQLLLPDLYGGLSVLIANGWKNFLAYFEESPYLRGNVVLLWGVLWAGVLILAAYWRMRSLPRRLGLILVTGYLAVSWAIVYYLTTLGQPIQPFAVGYWGLNAFLLVFVFLLVGQACYALIAGHGAWKARMAEMPWALAAAALVFVYAFGTDNPYAYHSGKGFFFFMLGTAILFLVFSNPINNMFSKLVVPTLLVAMVSIVSTSTSYPYRQSGPIWEMDTEVHIRSGKDTIYVEEDRARYLQAWQTLALFPPGTPLIDMTGHSPGVVYTLEGKAYGYPWIIGGYPGSDEMAVYILSRWSEQHLRQAWIITAEKNAVRPISLTVLDGIGLDFPADYVKAGTVVQPGSEEVQALWRPIE